MLAPDSVGVGERRQRASIGSIRNRENNDRQCPVRSGILLEISASAVDQGVDNLGSVSRAANLHANPVVGHPTLGLSPLRFEFDSNGSSTFIKRMTNNGGNQLGNHHPKPPTDFRRQLDRWPLDKDQRNISA